MSKLPGNVRELENINERKRALENSNIMSCPTALAPWRT